MNKKLGGGEKSCGIAEWNFDLGLTLIVLLFQKIYDINLDNEMRKQMSQNNYMLSKQRYEEKKKVQDALLLQKKEEAKQSKMIKNQNEQKKFMNNERIRQENKMKN